MKGLTVLAALDMAFCFVFWGCGFNDVLMNGLTSLVALEVVSFFVCV